MLRTEVQVWDLPIRLFHWLLVFSIIGLWVSADILQNFELHSKFGLFVVGLISFRLVYGIVGSSTARFQQFVKGKSAIMSYVSGNWKGIGHNPLGALSVITLIAISLLTVTSGLFTNNEGDFSSPLAFLITTDTSDWFNGLHETLANLLWFLIAVHLFAILVYKKWFAEDLVTPMLSGKVVVDVALNQEIKPAKTWAIGLSFSIALLAIWGASGIWHQPPANKPAVVSPEW
jgi:cytochrome b